MKPSAVGAASRFATTVTSAWSSGVSTTAGGAAKGKVLVRRSGGFDGEVSFALVSAPAGVTLKAKPAAKGAGEAEAEFAADAKATGAGPVVVKGTGKHQGKDFAYVAVLPKFEVTPAAKKK